MMTATTGMVWVHIHWLFAVMVIFGMIASLIWLSKFSTKKDFLNLVTFLLVIGVIGLLVTVPVAYTGFETAMQDIQSMMK